MPDKNKRLQYLRDSLLRFDLNRAIRYFSVIYLICVFVNSVGVAILEFVMGPKISVELGSLTEPDPNVTTYRYSVGSLALLLFS